MNIRPFALERYQSLYENTVEINLTESGFHPFRLKELLERDELDELEAMPLGYGQTNGLPGLRRRIADLYRGMGPRHILVTAGSSEANFVACHSLCSPGDEVVMMVPNYMQMQGVVEEMGCTVRFFHLLEDRNWAPDLDGLRDVVNERTRAILVCNPNNPTGYVLTGEEMKEIIEIADSVGAWVYADEVYRGAERREEETPSFQGMGKRVLVCGGLSKAYGLPGLRLGWLAGPPETIDDAWTYHDYTSITSGIISNRVAEKVLRPGPRAGILERNRRILKENLSICLDWARKQGDLISVVPPRAGAMLFLRYRTGMNSSRIAEDLRRKCNVLVVAGDIFGMDHFLRLGIGSPPEVLREGLRRLGEQLRSYS